VAACIWLTGPKGAGKSTIARAVVDTLSSRGGRVALLDERDARSHLAEGISAMAWLCRLLVDNRVTVVAAVDLASRTERDRIRDEVPAFFEVFVDSGRAADGYEEPFAPELRLPTYDRDPAASIAQLVSWLEDAGYVATEG
jgi:adenylylsulfate kinase